MNFVHTFGRGWKIFRRKQNKRSSNGAQARLRRPFVPETPIIEITPAALVLTMRMAA